MICHHVGLQHESNEKVHKDHLSEDYESEKVNEGELASTPLHTISLPLFVRLLILALNTFIGSRKGEIGHDQIPAFTCEASKEQQQ